VSFLIEEEPTETVAATWTAEPAKIAEVPGDPNARLLNQLNKKY
jgi:hypothetical protein